MLVCFLIVAIVVEFQSVTYVGREESGGVNITLVTSDPSSQALDVIVEPRESANCTAKGSNNDL